MEENKPMFPTEEVTLPSKGLIYPQDNPLAKGVLEMKYMTAKEEDILTNESYIKNGSVIIYRGSIFAQTKLILIYLMYILESTLQKTLMTMTL